MAMDTLMSILPDENEEKARLQLEVSRHQGTLATIWRDHAARERKVLREVRRGRERATDRTWSETVPKDGIFIWKGL